MGNVAHTLCACSLPAWSSSVSRNPFFFVYA